MNAWLRDNADILAGIGLTLSLAIAADSSSGAGSIWRLALTLPVVLVIPGYATVLLIFPRRSDLDQLARWGLSLVMSSLEVCLLVFVLSKVGIPIDEPHLAGSLLLVIMVLGVAAAFRRATTPPRERYVFVRPRGVIPWLVVALSLALVAGTGLVMRSNLSSDAVSFYVTGTRGHLGKIPVVVPAGEQTVLGLHIINPTESDGQWLLVIRKRDRSVLMKRDVQVPAHSRWDRDVTVRGDMPPHTEHLAFYLYRGKAVVRRLTLHLHVIA